MDSYLAIVVVLLVLAVADLVVGVSNDAVNFLNSAVGSKVAPRRIILAVAALGILAGALSSSGMMEVARKGIFDPSFFSFADVMVIFLAVMLTDILLLDAYNSLGLPTSTTVSIIFELLGAAMVVGWLRMQMGGTDAKSIFDMINTAKVSEIIGGIFLSVLIAFVVGVAIMWLVRFLFTFHFKDKLLKRGSIFSGVAITFIIYFMLVKGLKGTDLMSGAFGSWIQENTWYVMGGLLVFLTALSFALQRYFGVDPLRVVVLAGTFSLAMAFAGNDLVNFIGVPIAGLQSFQLWSASNLPAESHMMDGLATAMRTPAYLLYIAGGVMVLTLWFSGKARKVTDTEVSLSRQGSGAPEKFKSHMLARFIVRGAMRSAATFNSLLSHKSKVVLQKRFRSHGLMKEQDAPAFDMVRASMNLMLASVLIAAATKLKLPLSTTFVSFMVAMGTSLADRAWGAGTAEYRVAGVLNVIGGWLLTAAVAFLAAGLMALIIHFGGNWMGVVLFVVVAAVLVRSHLPRRNRILNSALPREDAHAAGA
jgi:phosphate/sulfate permease